MEELELLLVKENLDIVAITESWLYPEIVDEAVSFDGYRLIRRDRKDDVKTKGGGVALYLKNDLKVTECYDIVDERFKESLFCKIGNKYNKIILGVCYRAPDNSNIQDEGLFSIIHKAADNECVILGDFNYSELNWRDTGTISDSHAFVNCINDNFLHQLVETPTRGEKILDLILCKDETIVENVRVGEPFSDHRIIRFNLYVDKKDDIKVLRHDYFKADYNEIRDCIKSYNWSNSIETRNVEEMWIEIKNKLIELRDKFIPKAKEKKSRCKWANKTVEKLRNIKNKAWNKFIKSNKDQKLYETYKVALRNSVKANRMAKIAFEEKLARNIKNDSKSFYAYARSKQKNKVTVGPLSDYKGNIIDCDQEASEMLNDYFVSVFTKENNKEIPESELIFDHNIEALQMIDINENIVLEKLSKIKTSKSPGPDGIHPKLLFELRNELSGPLTKLFQKSIKLGQVPQEWKDANVVPLFKKGKRDKCENYRPVSLTCILCKVLESIIKDNLVEHLYNNKLIKDSQHGFTQGRSCLTNLLEFLESVTKWVDDGKAVDLIYLDFAKAFDKVAYQRLFKKLEAHKIVGNLLGWIQQWLTNRRQRVNLGNTSSSWHEVFSGVPQGSVLGPILFLIYINDLDCNLTAKVNKFADDTKLGNTVDNPEEIEMLQFDLDKLFSWAQDWQMQFNIDKCAVIHLGHNNSFNEYKMGNNTLKSVTNERDLGVIIDSTLKFSEHCNKIVKEANSSLGLIKRTIKSRNKDVIFRLYKSLVRPKLDYCAQVYHPYLKRDIVNIEKVQHRATKLINECRNLNYEKRLESLEIISLEERRVRGDLIEVYKIVKGIDKLQFSDFFEFNNNGLRGHKYKLAKKRNRLDIRQNFFSQRIVDVWNELPEKVVESESLNTFKNRLDDEWHKLTKKMKM